MGAWHLISATTLNWPILLVAVAAAVTGVIAFLRNDLMWGCFFAAATVVGIRLAMSL
jgi:hypothetical protein